MGDQKVLKRGCSSRIALKDNEILNLPSGTLVWVKRRRPMEKFDKTYEGPVKVLILWSTRGGASEEEKYRASRESKEVPHPQCKFFAAGKSKLTYNFVVNKSGRCQRVI